MIAACDLELLIFPPCNAVAFLSKWNKHLAMIYPFSKPKAEQQYSCLYEGNYNDSIYTQ